MSDNAELTGVLLVGHGTRSGEGTGQFLGLAARMAESVAPVPVEAAFLELQQPGIDVAVGRLVERGIGRLVTMPLLLFAAGHAKRDIPEQVAVALARRGRSDVDQVQAAHLGCHPEVVELSRRRMEGLVRFTHPTSVVGTAHPTCLLLVGRGSNDASATAEMYEFAGLREKEARREPRPPIHIEVAFLAMARPLLEDELARIAGQGYARVIVQPHLLFHGELIDSIESKVAKMATEHVETQWIVAPPLADPAGIVTSATKSVQKVILDRVHEAGIHVVANRGGD